MITKIKHYRELRGWSQTRLAKESGVSPSAISQYESKKRKLPSIDTLCKIADALSVTVDALLGRNEDPLPIWEVRGEEIPNILKKRPFKIIFY